MKVIRLPLGLSRHQAYIQVKQRVGKNFRGFKYDYKTGRTRIQ